MRHEVAPSRPFLVRKQRRAVGEAPGHARAAQASRPHRGPTAPWPAPPAARPRVGQGAAAGGRRKAGARLPGRSGGAESRAGRAPFAVVSELPCHGLPVTRTRTPPHPSCPSCGRDGSGLGGSRARLSDWGPSPVSSRAWGAARRGCRRHLRTASFPGRPPAAVGRPPPGGNQAALHGGRGFFPCRVALQLGACRGGGGEAEGGQRGRSGGG